MSLHCNIICDDCGDSSESYPYADIEELEKHLIEHEGWTWDEREMKHRCDGCASEVGR